jgi:hypothetical protein
MDAQSVNATKTTMWVDGFLYAMIALFPFLYAYLNTDDAKKHISEEARFWVLMIIGSGNTVFTAIKMFRSTTFAEVRMSTGNGNGNGNGIPAPQPPKQP